LLGGVVIRAGDKVIDGSATARLRELSTALA
jgi:F0F1-type ATP synthase delta subunit